MNYDVVIIGAGPVGLFSAYELIEKDENLIERANVTDIKTVTENNHEIVYKYKNQDVVINVKNVIVAPGRTGAKWVQELADKYKIPYLSPK